MTSVCLCLKSEIEIVLLCALLPELWCFGNHLLIWVVIKIRCLMWGVTDKWEKKVRLVLHLFLSSEFCEMILL